MTIFYKNYVQLCALKKVSLSAAAEAVGLSRTSPNGWKKGKQPSDVTLAKLADFFGCPVDALTGQKEMPAHIEVNEPNKAALLSWIETASRDELIEALQAVTKKLSEK